MVGVAYAEGTSVKWVGEMSTKNKAEFFRVLFSQGKQCLLFIHSCIYS